MLLHEQILEKLDNSEPLGAHLTSIFEIEDALRALSTLEEKLEHLEGVKRYRIETVTAEIGDCKARVDVVRELILETIKQFGEDKKTFTFPDVGKVTRKELKGSWDIEDEKAVMQSFERLGVLQDVVVVKQNLDRKKAKELIEQYAGTNEQIEGAIFKEGSETLSVSFEKKEQKAEKKETKKPEFYAEPAKTEPAKAKPTVAAAQAKVKAPRAEKVMTELEV